MDPASAPSKHTTNRTDETSVESESGVVGLRTTCLLLRAKKRRTLVVYR